VVTYPFVDTFFRIYELLDFCILGLFGLSFSASASSKFVVFEPLCFWAFQFCAFQFWAFRPLSLSTFEPFGLWASWLWVFQLLEPLRFFRIIIRSLDFLALEPMTFFVSSFDHGAYDVFSYRHTIIGHFGRGTFDIFLYRHIVIGPFGYGTYDVFRIVIRPWYLWHFFVLYFDHWALHRGIEDFFSILPFGHWAFHSGTKGFFFHIVIRLVGSSVWY